MANAGQLFANYTKITPRLPVAFWSSLRILTLCGTLVVAAILIRHPDIGLRVFWGLMIPVVPALLVIAPGLWRQICPMAFLNQIPRMTHISAARDLPETGRKWAFAVAVLFFFVCIALRAPVLNHNGLIVGIGLFAVLLLALLGGLIFKGRSGWCGTFCPLGPIQRDYGQAPVLVVRNGYCENCVGCQKNCYDFNPRAAVFGDLYDDDPRYAGQRRFFMAMLPGIIFGYFLQDQHPAYGPWIYALILIGSTCASVGVYQTLTSFFSVTPFRAANLFACIALMAFYAFAVPIVVRAFSYLAHVDLALPAQPLGLALGALLAGVLIYKGRSNERIYEHALNSADQLRVDEGGRSLHDRMEDVAGARVSERGSGKAFPVAAGQTLLEAMEAANVKINFGCRSGLCGADPVVICEGDAHVSPPSPDELATLKRLGLDGVARLACVCQVKGPIVIDRDVRNAKHAATAPSQSAEDPLKAQGIGRVVIVGNGVAGIGVADALRRASASVEIVVVTDEPHHFYNRMAIGRVIYGRSAMDGLFLLPEDWYADNRVDVWRNTLAASIDRETRNLVLGTGEKLAYDRLILATGAHAQSPDARYAQYPNAFVLRQAADAQAIRSFMQLNQARRAVVLGGGVLGVEAADALHHLGLKVTILQRSGRLMERQLDRDGAARLTNYLTNIEIDVLTDAVVTGFEGDINLESVVLKDGRQVTGDLFIACAGIVPRIDLAKASGLATKRGILVDTQMRTSDSSIYAVGDVAELEGMLGGLWPIAGAQAETLVADLAGQAKPYATPHVVLQLKCDGVDLKSFGEIEPQPGDESLTADAEDIEWWRINLRGGKVVGGVFVGLPGSSRIFVKLLQPDADIEAALPALRCGKLPEMASA